MKEIFLKHQTIIFRGLGAFMLLVGFVTYFWTTPKEALTQNEIAAANVARMEARVSGGSGGSTKKPKSSSSKFMEQLKDTQAVQARYLTILAMIFGVGFLGYSFVGKKKSNLD